MREIKEQEASCFNPHIFHSSIVKGSCNFYHNDQPRIGFFARCGSHSASIICFCPSSMHFSPAKVSKQCLSTPKQ